MEFVNETFRRAFDRTSATNATNSSFMEDVNSELNLSYTKRIALFATSLGLGLFFLILSTWMIIRPTTFAKFYTLGTLFIISSTFFLVGPMRQLRSMFHPSRIIAAGIYVGSMVMTLFCALSLQNTLLTLGMIVIQFGAMIWYGASYIPFAQNCLRGTARTILPM